MYNPYIDKASDILLSQKADLTYLLLHADYTVLYSSSILYEKGPNSYIRSTLQVRSVDKPFTVHFTKRAHLLVRHRRVTPIIPVKRQRVCGAGLAREAQ